MNGHLELVAGCLAAAAIWLAFACVTFAGRLRHDRRSGRGTPSVRPGSRRERRLLSLAAAPVGVAAEGQRGFALAALSRADHPEARALLTAALRTGDEEVRRAAVTGLGALGERHDWAIDALIEALAEGQERPARVASQLERLAPRVGGRLVPLLAHPSGRVRFWAVRLLARHGQRGLRDVRALAADPDARIRAAALETMSVLGDTAALRLALDRLADRDARVRAQAVRTAADLGGSAVAPFLLPALGDDSWWVRRAAHEQLTGLASRVVPLLAVGLQHTQAEVRAGSARVLQDAGLVDALAVGGANADLLQQALAAGGDRMRAAVTVRTRRKVAG